MKHFLCLRPAEPHWPYEANSGFLEEFFKDEAYQSGPLTMVSFDNYSEDGLINYDDLSDVAKTMVGFPSSIATNFMTQGFIMRLGDCHGFKKLYPRSTRNKKNLKEKQPPYRWEN